MPMEGSIFATMKLQDISLEMFSHQPAMDSLVDLRGIYL